MIQSFFTRKSLILTAVVATVFSVIVALLITRDFLHRAENDVIESATMVALREQLREDPGDQGVRDQIRQRDVVLRENYFRSQHYLRQGAYLLAGGLVIAALAGTIALTLGSRWVRPLAVVDEAELASKETRRGLWAVVVMVAITASGSIAIVLHEPAALSDLSTNWNRPDGASNLGADNAGVTTDAKRASEQPFDSNDSRTRGLDALGSGALGSGALDLPDAEEIGRNWPTFRGPHGSGIALSPEEPVRWDVATGEGIVWKTPVPLIGNSSPVVWEEHVFLTGATDSRREVFCFDSGTGKLLWQRDVSALGSTSSTTVKVSEETGYAAPTAATDGRRVLAMFAQGDVVALDVSGQVLWSRSLGVPENIYGHAASLALAGELLIVQFDQGSKKQQKSKLLALHVQTGKTVWEVPREVPNSWSSPIVIEHEGQSKIITCADPWVIAYAVEDGKEIWRAKCLRQDVGPTPVYSNGVLYVASEFPGISAILSGGQGDVTDSRVKWTAEYGAPDTCSPLVSDGLLLVMASYGTLTCYDAVEGGEDPLWEEDFEDTFRSSPARIGKYVYLFGESGKVWVVEATRDSCDTVAESDLGEACVTSPAVVAGKIYVRGEKHLFCFGGK